MNFTLTLEEKKELELQHHYEGDSRVCDRICEIENFRKKNRLAKPLLELFRHSVEMIRIENHGLG